MTTYWNPRYFAYHSNYPALTVQVVLAKSSSSLLEFLLLLLLPRDSAGLEQLERIW